MSYTVYTEYNLYSLSYTVWLVLITHLPVRIGSKKKKNFLTAVQT